MLYNLSQLSLRERDILFSSLRIEHTHYSNSIEGSSLTLGETADLLKNGRAAKDKPMFEQLIILGYAKAFDIIVRDYQRIKFNSDFIKDIHALIFEGAKKYFPENVSFPVGAYRNEEKQIKGIDITLSHPKQIHQDIENLLFRFPNKGMNLNDIAQFHLKFEKIHPFSDGNGRTGRLITLFQCVNNDIIPPLIDNSSRLEYINAFQDVNKLEQLLKTAIQKSIKLIPERNIGLSL